MMMKLMLQRMLLLAFLQHSVQRQTARVQAAAMHKAYPLLLLLLSIRSTPQ
jgi:hypothetical protein